MAEPRLVFVLSPHQNAFFHELAEALVLELGGLGAEAIIWSKDDLEPDPRDVYVLLPPHEYFALEGHAWTGDDDLLARTVFISAEQPSSVHFSDNLRHAQKAGAVFDFSPWSVARYRDAGIEARWLTFGYTRSWDRYSKQANERTLDLLFMGAITPRRERMLAWVAPVAERLRSRFIISDNSSPNTGDSASFVTGDSKRQLLADTRILLNLHQTDEPYFEWLRFSEAAMSGAVVLSEPSIGTGLFVPNHHFACATEESLPQIIGQLHDDGVWQDWLRRNAFELVRDHPLTAGAADLLDAASRLTTGPVPLAIPGPMSVHGYRPPSPRVAWMVGENPDAVVTRQVLREIRLDQIEISRQLDRFIRSQTEPPPARLVLVARSAARRRATRVSVVMALYNHGDYVADALASVADGTYSDLEVIVVDDGSKDHSLAVVQQWMHEHPHIPATLLHHPINQGLPVSRNDALAFAQGDYVFVLDADNEIAPRGIERLVAALDADTDAWFAYGILQRFDEKGPVGLMGVFPFSPARLRRGNYIDAMALIRRSRIAELGGYTTDRRLYGWEDYDLWCRMAEHGGAGAHVPTFVGRYRTSPTSMVSLSNISHLAPLAALREHCPTLMAEDEAEANA